MELIVDEGNTRIKLAVFDGKKFKKLLYSSLNSFLDDVKALQEEFCIEKMMISSVTDGVLGLLNSVPLEKVFLSPSLKFPFENKYKTISTLGLDRLALITAACVQYQNQHSLVIDAGTCVTYDFITADKKNI